MEFICWVPPLTSNAVNLQSDPSSAAALASPFDEVVVQYPIIVGGNANDIRLCNQTLQLLSDRQVWFAPNVLWPQFGSDDPTTAYNNALAATLAEIVAFFTMIPSRFKSRVKGIAFNHVEYARMFGNYNLATTPRDTFRNLDRFYVNSLIQFAHLDFNMPAMLVTSRPADVTGNIYRSQDVSQGQAGAAKWRGLLGNDSFFVDWLLARDVFYEPALNTAISDQNYTPGPTARFQFEPGTLGTWSRFFSAIPVLQRVNSDNLNVGILQHLDFSSETTDFSLSPNLTSSQQTFMQGMNLWLSLTGIDGYCFLPIPAAGNGIFIADLHSVNQMPSSGFVAPAQSSPARFFSAQGSGFGFNAAVYADYLSGTTPTRIVTDSAFSSFSAVQTSA
jgi:hypothetical protein